MKKVFLAIVTGLLFAAEIVLLKRYDVAAIGAGGTDVGFSTINMKVHELTGVHTEWYEITNYIGYLAIAVCLVFALVGLVQLIKRRSLIAVDREILALGGMFVLDILAYVLFEKFIVNYRPVYMDGSFEPEASFPSSHTLLGLTVMIATAMIIGKYVKSKGLASLIRVVCVVIALVCVAGRLYSGVHWLTDIVGGVLLSVTFLLLFAAAKGNGEGASYDAYGKPKKMSTVGYTPKH